MSLPANVTEQIERWLPKLTPQPVTSQLPKTMELSEAERELGIKVLNHYSWGKGNRRIVVRQDGETYYHSLWANNGRPYIRLTHPQGGLVDVFLLPA